MNEPFDYEFKDLMKMVKAAWSLSHLIFFKCVHLQVRSLMCRTVKTLLKARTLEVFVIILYVHTCTSSARSRKPLFGRVRHTALHFVIDLDTL